MYTNYEPLTGKQACVVAVTLLQPHQHLFCVNYVYQLTRLVIYRLPCNSYLFILSFEIRCLCLTTINNLLCGNKSRIM